MKPMLASDWEEDKLRFPLIAQPKIDGVRALNMVGTLTGRSLKTHKNKFITRQFSHSALIGFDGEMACERETHPDLCRITSSALSTITGQPYVLWWLFDYITVELKAAPYAQRLTALHDRLLHIRSEAPHLWPHLRLVPWVMVGSLDELYEQDAKWLDDGFEGTITRDPNAVHKQGRSTAKEGGLNRIKRFVDFEFRVTEVIEGKENQNEAQINELGLQFRSSHQANMIPNGMVGAMLGVTLSDVKDTTGNIVFKQGEPIKVGAGRMTHDERKYYLTHQEELMSKVSKGKFFPKGIKDELRFPTWQAFRSAEDL